jgi:pyruvate, water dikinase
VRRTELDESQASAPSLTDAEIVAVARLARAAERHYGCPQDVEWAVVGDGQAGDPRVMLLQARPETVWSKKKTTVSTGLDPMASIVATLSSPLHARKP